jgi:glutathione synthase/RimK-type ligase-like ATP-grasp enzyme
LPEQSAKDYIAKMPHAITPPTVLFLTTQPPSTIRAEWPYYQNYNFPSLLKQKNATVTFKSWLDEDIIAAIRQVDVVTFLWCNEYYKHPKPFLTFLDELDGMKQHGQDVPRIINNINLIRWNSDKHYLLDMEREGFEIPRTQVVTPQGLTTLKLQELIQDFRPAGPVVLKPTMSASSTMTWKIVNTAMLSADDSAFLELCTSGGLESSLLIQEFEPAILVGEYSFVFVAGQLTHVMIKTPRKGDFRVQDDYGGSARLAKMCDIAPQTLQVVHAIHAALQRRFEVEPCDKIGYARIDGLITCGRPFVLMEIEAIEPHLWLESTGKGEMDRMLAYLVQPSA